MVRHILDNGAGWHLSLSESHDPERFDPSLAPILIVPGYGMNSFIFGYHPGGESLEGHLIRAGFEVWKADLRGQGSAVRLEGSSRIGLADLALVDLDAMLAAVRTRTRSKAAKVHVIGASLGGSLMLTHAVIRGTEAYASLVAMGSPIRWVDVHPVVKVAFGSPALVGAVSLRGPSSPGPSMTICPSTGSPALVSVTRIGIQVCGRMYPLKPASTVNATAGAAGEAARSAAGEGAPASGAASAARAKHAAMRANRDATAFMLSSL